MTGIWVAVAAALLLAGCSSTKTANMDPFAGKGSPIYKGKGPIPKGGGKYVVGEPYQVAGRWFRPKEQSSYDKVGLGSWYGPQFHRRMTSNGEWFDMEYPTAAHATLPLPSYARVTNLENGRQIVVRINDRGPFVGDRIIDLSKKSAELLGYRDQGTAQVRVQYLGPAPLNDRGADLMAMNQKYQRRGAPEVMVAQATTPVPAPKAAPKPVAPAPAYVMASIEPLTFPAAKSESEFFVQVGAFSSADNAERTREELAETGPVEVLPLAGATGMLYRVRIGPLSDEHQAATAMEAAMSAGHSDARLIVANNML